MKLFLILFCSIAWAQTNLDERHAQIAREMQARLDSIRPALDGVRSKTINLRKYAECRIRQHWYTPWRRCHL